KLTVGADHVLNEYGHTQRKLAAERSPQTSQPGSQISLDRSPLCPVLDKNLYRDRAAPFEIPADGTSDRREGCQRHEPDAVDDVRKILNGGVSQELPPVRRLADPECHAHQIPRLAVAHVSEGTCDLSVVLVAE